MRFGRICALLIAALSLSAAAAARTDSTREPARRPASAVEPSAVVPIWSGIAPGSEHARQIERASQLPGGQQTVIRNVVQPTLTAYLPEPSRATGTGVIIAPGGGFRFLSMDIEGHDVARWLVERGIAAFVLKYRVVETPADDTLAWAAVMASLAAAKVSLATLDDDGQLGVADGLQAMKLVRENAKKWGVTRDRIGFLGFSAGAMIASHTMLRSAPADRPAFVAPIYGAPFGKMPDIAAQLPPVFLAYASDDSLVAARVNEFDAALRKAGHRPALRVYSNGGHGFGMKKQGTSSDRWIDDFHQWLVSLGFTVPAVASGQQTLVTRSDDSLHRQFMDPPPSARPRVWWHWMNGNITKEGIKLDLEWMKRVGIGGFQNFDAHLFPTQVVERRLAYMTPEWIDALRYTTDLAEQHGLEMAIAASAGWSETGGPWVKPHQAMKKLVWTETEITGGRRYNGKLARPSDVSGPFQDVPQARGILNTPKPWLRLYVDAAVVAFPVADDAAHTGAPTITRSNGEPIDASILSDGVLTNSVKLDFGANDARPCVRFDYRRATPISSLLLAVPIGPDFFRSATAVAVLEASDDGVAYRKVTDVPSGTIVQHTISFAPISSRYFRVCFSPPPKPYTDLMASTAPGANRLGLFEFTPPQSMELHELRLFSTARVHRAEEKAGFAFVEDYYSIATASVDSSAAVPAAKVIDLTQEMRPDGTLAWTPPAGRWKVLRFGYSLTGKENHPATPEATGLEVDKLDRDHVKAYLDAYLGKYEGAVGPQRLGAKGIRALLVDSIEVGPQNWTESLPAEFRRRRGYDITPWMPALAGVIVGSAEQSDKFLYDFRRTLGDMIADHHYGQIAQTAEARGLIQYGEALEQGRPVLGDDMEMRRHATIPMAAMWTYSPRAGAPTPPRFADMRGAASVAHIYGQNLVAAESLTSDFAPWAHAPRDLKPMMDLEFALGINRPVIHTSVHQPLIDKAPGLTLAIFGQYFNRNESWAEQAGPWVTYLSRTSHLLQQGKFAADVAYFYGEEAPLTALYREHITPDTPTGHGFDFVNSDVVLNRLAVDRGDLVTQTGMRYRLLYLGGTSLRMTLPVLGRIEQLVMAGATVVGDRPIATPSLSDDAGEFAKIADRLWSGAAGPQGPEGRVITGRNVDAALLEIGVPRDFDYDKPQADSNIMFLHRRLDDGDAYFLTNRQPREEVIEASFRVSGKLPEIWRAESGRREPVSYRIEAGRTIVPLRFAPHEAFFVVFREPAVRNELKLAPAASVPLTKLTGDWSVSFQPGRGGPSSARKMAAGSWSENAEPAVRYFSGTASYVRELSVPAQWTAGGNRLMLDLGEVRELAEVLINDRSLGIVWHPPYRIDITDAVKRGVNRLEVRVTNLWVNRLIGDAQPDAQKITFTTFPPYLPDAPLRPSGLLGPVTVERVHAGAGSE